MAKQKINVKVDLPDSFVDFQGWGGLRKEPQRRRQRRCTLSMDPRRRLCPEDKLSLTTYIYLMFTVQFHDDLEIEQNEPHTLWRAQDGRQTWLRWGRWQPQLSPWRSTYAKLFFPTSSRRPMPRTEVLRGKPQTEVKQGFSLHMVSVKSHWNGDQRIV